VPATPATHGHAPTLEEAKAKFREGLEERQPARLSRREQAMNRNVRGRLMAAVLFVCAVAVVGLAITGVLELRSRAPVAVVAR
jgi:hypothetical protein